MQNPATDIQEMIKELNRFQLPRSPMESFDTWREGVVRAACREFTPSRLNWFLDLLNRFRGPEDRKGSILDGLRCRHVYREPSGLGGAPGTIIELPPLTSDVAGIAGEIPSSRTSAWEEIRSFRDLAISFTDEEIVGLAKIARVSLAQQGGPPALPGRQSKFDRYGSRSRKLRIVSRQARKGESGWTSMQA